MKKTVSQDTRPFRPVCSVYFSGEELRAMVRAEKDLPEELWQPECRLSSEPYPIGCEDLLEAIRRFKREEAEAGQIEKWLVMISGKFPGELMLENALGNRPGEDTESGLPEEGADPLGILPLRDTDAFSDVWNILQRIGLYAGDMTAEEIPEIGEAEEELLCRKESRGKPLADRVWSIRTRLRFLEAYRGNQMERLPGAYLELYRRFLLELSERNVPAALEMLADCYAEGNRAFPRNPYLAKAFYETTFRKRGSARSAEMLGKIYYYGETGTPDYAKAFSCLSYAAEDGRYGAAVLLSECFLKGRGVPENREIAGKILRRAYEEQKSRVKAGRREDLFPETVLRRVSFLEPLYFGEYVRDSLIMLLEAELYLSRYPDSGKEQEKEEIRNWISCCRNIPGREEVPETGFGLRSTFPIECLLRDGYHLDARLTELPDKTWRLMVRRIPHPWEIEPEWEFIVFPEAGIAAFTDRLSCILTPGRRMHGPETEHFTIFSADYEEPETAEPASAFSVILETDRGEKIVGTAPIRYQFPDPGEKKTEIPYFCKEGGRTEI